MRFSGKCAIVTGSSSGIGRATAILLAKEGASVLVHGRNLEGINKTIAECKKVAAEGTKFPYVQGDVADEETLVNIKETASKTFRKIDILINNAGFFKPHDLSTGSMEDFDLEMKVMLRAPMYLSQLCLPALKQTGGNIVSMSDSFSTNPTDICPFSSITKAGLNMFTQCAALEFGPQGVRVNAVLPGYVRNYDNLKNLGLSKEAQVELYANAEKMVPNRKIGTVEETAKLIAFLASDDATMMNGACVKQDGGHTLIGLDKATMENAAK